MKYTVDLQLIDRAKIINEALIEIVDYSFSCISQWHSNMVKPKRRSCESCNLFFVVQKNIIYNIMLCNKNFLA